MIISAQQSPVKKQMALKQKQSIHHQTTQRKEVDWLIYDDPVTYTNLVINGELEQYVKLVTGLHCLED